MKETLVVIPCGKAKIWDTQPNAGPTPARDAYIGAPFKVNRRFAERKGADWRILSAKYGFIGPDFVIPGNYDVAFNRPSSKPIGLVELQSQIRSQGLTVYETIIGLGGVAYLEILRRTFAGTAVRLIFPFQGLGLGKGMQAVKAATAQD